MTSDRKPGKPERVTRSGGNDQLLYFTSTSLLADGSGIVFLSDHGGNPNLFFADLKGGCARQLTRNEEGFLKSYVYFSGTPYRGFGKASVALDAERGIAYYIQGREIRAVDVEGGGRVLAELPSGQMTAFTHVSADGRLLCVPTVDARALDDENRLPPAKPEYDVDARVQEEELCSYLRVYDTATGRELSCGTVPKAWITHVQFSPVDSRLVLYNHEWASFDCGVRRLWLWDGTSHRALRTEGREDGNPLRSRNDWACHEMWERDGSAIIYHGGYDGGSAFLGRVGVDGSGVREIALPCGWHQYGHFTVGAPGTLVSDGYYQTPATAEGGMGKWIALLDVDWEGGRIAWRPLGLNRSSWTSQDAHPHPILDDAGRWAYFTSDAEGSRAVYRFRA